MRQKLLLLSVGTILIVFALVSVTMYVTLYRGSLARTDETLIQFAEVSASLIQNQIGKLETIFERLGIDVSRAMARPGGLAADERVRARIAELSAGSGEWTVLAFEATGGRRELVSGDEADVPWSSVENLVSEGGGSVGVRIPTRPGVVGILLVTELESATASGDWRLVALADASRVFGSVLAPLQQSFRGDLFLLDKQGRPVYFLSEGEYQLADGETRSGLMTRMEEMLREGMHLHDMELVGESSRVATRNIVGFGFDRYVVGAAFAHSRYAAERAGVVQALLVILAAALALSLAVSYPLSASITNPIKKLVEATRIFKRDEVLDDIPVRSRDEIGELSRSFCEMAQGIARAHEELKEANLNLEQRVDEQTRQLSRALENLLEKNDAIEAAHSNIEAVLHSIMDGVLVTDRERRIVQFNPPAQAILGLDAAAGGRPAADSVRVEPVLDLIMGHNLDEGSFRLPVPVRFELDGMAIMAQTYPYKSQSGKHLGLVTVLRDITREQEIERMKEEFLAKISHELRTPMTSIKGFAELMLDGAVGELNEDQQGFMTDIQEEAERLERLINNLLDLSKLEARKMMFHKVEADLGELAERTVSLMRPQIEAKGLDVGLEREGDLVGMVDPDRILQVIINLVSNAVKFTPEGGSVSLLVRSRNADGYYVEVRDTGIGIPAEHLDLVFNKFEQGPARAAGQAGTGLGLPICREIIEAHDGAIGVESEPGRGARFFFELPRVRVEETQVLES